VLVRLRADRGHGLSQQASRRRVGCLVGLGGDPLGGELYANLGARVVDVAYYRTSLTLASRERPRPMPHSTTVLSDRTRMSVLVAR